MVLWFEEAGVVAAMVAAVAIATAVFVWATWSLVVGSVRYRRSQRAEAGSRTARPRIVVHRHPGGKAA